MTCIICTSCTKNTFRAKDSTLHSWYGNLKHKNILPFKLLWSIIWLDLNTKSKNYINWINMSRNYLWLVPTPKQYIQNRKNGQSEIKLVLLFFGSPTMCINCKWSTQGKRMLTRWNQFQGIRTWVKHNT